MYSAKFISDKGITYLFGEKGKTAFSMDVGNGISVNLGTTQGFLQIGESVEAQSIRGKPIYVIGAVYGNVEAKKNELRKAFAPFTSGKLIFNDTHFIRVYVEKTPTFSSKKGNGRFTLQLYAPNPFFQSVTENIYRVGQIIPVFKFPVNYSSPHKFGVKDASGVAKIRNNGDISVPLNIKLSFVLKSTNPVITDYISYKSFKINGEFSAGDVVSIYRDEKNVLKVELLRDQITEDILNLVDESSTLFEINVGDSLFLVTDDEGGVGIDALITFNESVVSVYES